MGAAARLGVDGVHAGLGLSRGRLHGREFGAQAGREGRLIVARRGKLGSEGAQLGDGGRLGLLVGFESGAGCGRVLFGSLDVVDHASALAQDTVDEVDSAEQLGHVGTPDDRVEPPVVAAHVRLADARAETLLGRAEITRGAVGGAGRLGQLRVDALARGPGRGEVVLVRRQPALDEQQVDDGSIMGSGKRLSVT